MARSISIKGQVPLPQQASSPPPGFPIRVAEHSWYDTPLAQRHTTMEQALDNAQGFNSASAALLVTERGWAEKHGAEPLVRIVSYGVGAVEPGMFGLGPVPAVHQALERAGWSIADLERVEINEAFAAIAIAVTRKLGLPEDVVNVQGGAIAHGHPIGATGAILTTRLIHSTKRDSIGRGRVTLCIGGGQGIALAMEAIT